MSCPNSDNYMSYSNCEIQCPNVLVGCRYAWVISTNKFRGVFLIFWVIPHFAKREEILHSCLHMLCLSWFGGFWELASNCLKPASSGEDQSADSHQQYIYNQLQHSRSFIHTTVGDLANTFHKSASGNKLESSQQRKQKFLFV